MLYKLKGVLIEPILNLLSPPVCVLCDKSMHDDPNKKAICTSCYGKIKFIDEIKHRNICPRCSAPYEHVCRDCLEIDMRFEKLLSIFLCDGIGQKIIHELKFKGKFFIIRDFEQKIREKLSEVDFDLIVPVPSDVDRFVRRGYNPSYFISKTISEIFRKDVMILLKKTENRKPQLELNRKDRIENPKGAFGLFERNLRRLKATSKRVLLVDDFAITCATLSECSRVLEKHFDTIYAFTLARATED